jgi:hypothetical protein
MAPDDTANRQRPEGRGSLAEQILGQAIRRVPAVRFFLGVVGVIAALSLIGALVLQDWRVAFVGGIVVFIGGLLIRVFSIAGPMQMDLPFQVLVWFGIIIFICAASCLFSSLFFGKPLDLRHWIDGTRSDVATPVNPTPDVAHDAPADAPGNARPEEPQGETTAGTAEEPGRLSTQSFRASFDVTLNGQWPPPGSLKVSGPNEASDIWDSFILPEIPSSNLAVRIPATGTYGFLYSMLELRRPQKVSRTDSVAHLTPNAYEKLIPLKPIGDPVNVAFTDADLVRVVDLNQ